MANENVQCLIEHHATLFGLISKHTHKLLGADAKDIILDAVTAYGQERGRRMAKAAISNGDEINIINNQAYGEWIPNYPEQMEFGFIRGEPTLQTYISKCAWWETWKKRNLIDYGKLYCDAVDNAVYQGFDPNHTCTILHDTLSYGGDRCEFDWEIPMTADDFETLRKKKENLGESHKKDFNFHTAHLLSTVGDIVCSRGGEKGSLAVKNAIAEYIDLFGKEYYNVLLSYDKENF